MSLEINIRIKDNKLLFQTFRILTQNMIIPEMVFLFSPCMISFAIFAHYSIPSLLRYPPNHYNLHNTDSVSHSSDTRNIAHGALDNARKARPAHKIMFYRIHIADVRAMTDRPDLPLCCGEREFGVCIMCARV